MAQVHRYHPALVALHWLLALLIAGALGIGVLGLATTPDTDPAKLSVLRWHMGGGMIILVLMVVRFIVRVATARPPAVNRIVEISHLGFYLVVVLTVATGFATAILAGLPQIVFAGSGDPLPADLTRLPTRLVHGWLAWLLFGLIVLHIVGSIYHRPGMTDGPLRRMSFGPRH